VHPLSRSARKNESNSSVECPIVIIAIASSKNKSQNRGVFFRRQNATIISPRFTSNSPQLHHNKPGKKHRLSSKPPAKSPSGHAKEKCGPATAEPHFTINSPYTPA
jgi:hypothetical protein